MGRLNRGRAIIGDVTADLLARCAMTGLILLKQLFQAFDMLLKTMRFHSFALIILAPEFFPSKNSPFRYAVQIDNFCRPDDNCRGWQAMLQFNRRNGLKDGKRSSKTIL